MPGIENRILPGAFWSDSRYTKLPLAARLLALAIRHKTDPCGHLWDDPDSIAAFAFPFDRHVLDVPEIIDLLVASGTISRHLCRRDRRAILTDPSIREDQNLHYRHRGCRFPHDHELLRHPLTSRLRRLIALSRSLAPGSQPSPISCPHCGRTTGSVRWHLSFLGAATDWITVTGALPDPTSLPSVSRRLLDAAAKFGFNPSRPTRERLDLAPDDIPLVCLDCHVELFPDRAALSRAAELASADAAVALPSVHRIPPPDDGTAAYRSPDDPSLPQPRRNSPLARSRLAATSRDPGSLPSLPVPSPVPDHEHTLFDDPRSRSRTRTHESTSPDLPSHDSPDDGSPRRIQPQPQPQPKPKPTAHAPDPAPDPAQAPIQHPSSYDPDADADPFGYDLPDGWQPPQPQPQIQPSDDADADVPSDDENAAAVQAALDAALPASSPAPDASASSFGVPFVPFGPQLAHATPAAVDRAAAAAGISLAPDPASDLDGLPPRDDSQDFNLFEEPRPTSPDGDLASAAGHAHASDDTVTKSSTSGRFTAPYMSEGAKEGAESSRKAASFAPQAAPRAVPGQGAVSSQVIYGEEEFAAGKPPVGEVEPIEVDMDGPVIRHVEQDVGQAASEGSPAWTLEPSPVKTVPKPRGKAGQKAPERVEKRPVEAPAAAVAPVLPAAARRAEERAAARQRVFDHWRAVMNKPHATLKGKVGEKRRRKIDEALESYPEHVLLMAIDGCSLTPHNMGQNDRGEEYNDIELILRDAPHIERFVRNAQRPPEAPRRVSMAEAALAGAVARGELTREEVLEDIGRMRRGLGDVERDDG